MKSVIHNKLGNLRVTSAVFLFLLGITTPVLATAPVELSVTHLESVRTEAVSDETYENGWKRVFDLTVPENETILSVKLTDISDGTTTVMTAGNTRYFSPQGMTTRTGTTSLNALTIDVVNEYSGFIVLDHTQDLHPEIDGRQVQVYIDTRIPSTTPAGSYSMGFSFKTIVPTTEFDFVAPTIASTSNIIAEAENVLGALVSFDAPAATDVVDGPLATVCASASPRVFEMGTTTVVCTVTDAAGNTATSSFDVIVRDTTAPTITVVGDSPVTIIIGQTYTDAGATAHDSVDAAPVITNNAEIVDTNVEGTYTITYSATDRAGNTSQATREVQVVAGVQHEIVSTPGAHGTISPLGTVLVVEGTNKTFTVTPDFGYQIQTVTIDGTIIRDSRPAVDNYSPIMTKTFDYTFVAVAGNHTIEATFILNENDYIFGNFKKDIADSELRLANKVPDLPMSEYPQAAIDAFRAAVDVAIVARNNTDISRQDIRRAHDALMDAAEAFDYSRIPTNL